MTDQPQRDERMVRLRWACRRTLQALDRPLGNFLVGRYAGLTMAEQFAFERLLNARDQDILDWLIGHRQPTDQGIRSIIEAVRNHNEPPPVGEHHAQTQRSGPESGL